MAIAVLAIGILILLSYVLIYVFEKTQIPDVLLLMIIGIIAGPIAQWLHPGFFGGFGNVLTTIALIVILFEGGTNIHIQTLRSSIGPSLKLSLLSFLLTMGIGFIFGYLVLSLELIPSFILGAIIGGTSSAVVVPMVKGLNLSEKSGAILVLESALTDVLCIVLTGALIDLYFQGTGINLSIAGSIFLTLFFAIMLGVPASLLWLFIVARIKRLQNAMFSTVAAVLIIYAIAEIIGFSGAIAALSFGFVLTNQASIGFQRIGFFHNLSFAVISETERKFYSEIVFLLKTFFFLFLGLSIQFHSIISFLVSVMCVFVIYVGRLILCRVLVPRTTFRREVSIMSVMVPKGLAAAVLAGMPLQKNVAGGEIIQNTVYGIVLISIILTAVLIPIMNYTPIKNFYNRFFNSFHPDHFPESTDTSA